MPLLSELHHRLDPIIRTDISRASTEFNEDVRAITDEAIRHGAYGGSRMALALEQRFRDELARRIEVVWEAVEQARVFLDAKQSAELKDTLKTFLNEWLVVFQGELSARLQESVGQVTLNNESWKVRLEMKELREELLRSYGARVDILTEEISAKREQQTAARRAEILGRVLNWLGRVIARLIGR